MGKGDQQHIASVMKMLTDEKRVVTAKYCSHRLHINPSESRKVLLGTYEAHKSDKTVVPVYAVYYQQEAEDGENDQVEKFAMKLVQGDEEVERQEKSEKELYALAPHVVEDVGSLCFSTDSLCLKQLLNDDPHCLAAITCSQLKNNCPPKPVQQQTSSIQKQPEKSVPAKPSVDTKPVEKKTVPPKPAPQPASSFFGKQTSASSKKTEETIAKKSSPPKKSKKEEEPDEQQIVTKKKSRRVVVEDEDEDEDVEMKAVEPEKEPDEPAPEPEAMAVDVKNDEEHKMEEEAPVPTASLETNGGGTGARRLVERTYVDDEGYFVTEKTWTHDNAPSKPQPPSESAAKKTAPAPAPSKATKQSAKETAAKGKQTSLTSFFKKV